MLHINPSVPCTRFTTFLINIGPTDALMAPKNQDVDDGDLVSSSCVVLIPRHMNPACNVWRLLLQGNHQVHRLVVKPWYVSFNAKD